MDLALFCEAFLWTSRRISRFVYGGTETISKMASTIILEYSQRKPWAPNVIPIAKYLIAWIGDNTSTMKFLCVSESRVKSKVSHTALQTPQAAAMTKNRALSSFAGFHRERTNSRQAWKKKPATEGASDYSIQNILTNKWNLRITTRRFVCRSNMLSVQEAISCIIAIQTRVAATMWGPREQETYA